MAKDLVIVLAGGAGKRLLLLSEYRAKPAVPFGGIYRIVDFALSNCVNSGLFNIFVLSQYRPRSLMRHLDFGNPWDLNRLDAGMVILQPYVGNVGSSWYQGNADAVRQNIHLIEERAPEAVLVLAGDHIYKMDYRPLLEFHKQRHADLTVAVTKVRREETTKFGTCTLDKDKRIAHFEEKPETPKSTLASMGIYVFSRRALSECLLADADTSNSSHDFGRDIVPVMIKNREVYGYEFRGYWQDVGTIGTYFESNMALLEPDSPIDLYNTNWPILTKFEDLPPARMLESADVSDSMICDGSIIDGTVESSIISPGVVILKGAVVRNSIVLNGCVISEGARVNLSIIDKNTTVGTNTKIGIGIDFSPNQDHPAIMDHGVTLIGRGSHIPAESAIGRNCLVRTTQADDCPLEIESGMTAL
jgi:glucose-1-phosphate adenylyltransferase